MSKQNENKLTHIYLADCVHGHCALACVPVKEIQDGWRLVLATNRADGIVGQFGYTGCSISMTDKRVFETKKAALLHLHDLAEKHTEKCAQELVDARAQERKLRELFVDGL